MGGRVYNEYRRGPGGPGTGLGGPGGRFDGNRNSGKPLLLLRIDKLSSETHQWYLQRNVPNNTKLYG